MKLIVGLDVSPEMSPRKLHTRDRGAGHTGHQPPYDAFWGSRYAIIEDPDGNSIGLPPTS